MSKHNLISRLLAAFPSEPLPNPDALVEYPGCDEGVADFFRHRSWVTITASELRELDFAPMAFTEAAFTYFLPAYVRAYYEDRETLDAVSEKVVIKLGQFGHDAANPRTSTPRLSARFNATQLSAIREFLRYFAEAEGQCASEIYAPAFSVYLRDDA